MTKSLVIKNFKSIKNLQLDCKRVNVFIGDPNSGKSNILESISLLNMNEKLSEYVRFEQVQQLFFDFDSSLPIEVQIDDYRIKAWIEESELRIESSLGAKSPFLLKISLNGTMNSRSHNDSIKDIPKIRSYRFKEDFKLEEAEHDFLNTPFGDNLASVILYNKDLRAQVQNLLEGLGYKILVRTYEHHFEIYREHDGFTLSFPLSLVSDTVKRMIFYLAAIESNRKSIIVFEEPESNTFPLYIKYLAERIASFSENQYFITTHNPYFLQTIIEKTPTNELSINLVEMEHYQTTVTSLSEGGVGEILGLNSDVFLNFNKLRGE